MWQPEQIKDWNRGGFRFWKYLGTCSVSKVVSDSATLWTAARQASLSFTVSLSLLKFMSIESVMLSNYLILCLPLLLLPSILVSINIYWMKEWIESMIHCLQWLPSNYFLFSNLKSSVYSSTWGSPSQTLVVKNPPTVQDLQETWVRFLGGEDPLQKGIATHSSILAWRIPWTD